MAPRTLPSPLTTLSTLALQAPPPQAAPGGGGEEGGGEGAGVPPLLPTPLPPVLPLGAPGGGHGAPEPPPCAAPSPHPVPEGAHPALDRRHQGGRGGAGVR